MESDSDDTVNINATYPQYDQLQEEPSVEKLKKLEQAERSYELPIYKDSEVRLRDSLLSLAWYHNATKCPKVRCNSLESNKYTETLGSPSSSSPAAPAKGQQCGEKPV